MKTRRGPRFSSASGTLFQLRDARAEVLDVGIREIADASRLGGVRQRSETELGKEDLGDVDAALRVRHERAELLRIQAADHTRRPPGRSPGKTGSPWETRAVPLTGVSPPPARPAWQGTGCRTRRVGRAPARGKGRGILSAWARRLHAGHSGCRSPTWGSSRWRTRGPRRNTAPGPATSCPFPPRSKRRSPSASAWKRSVLQESLTGKDVQP